MLLLLLSFFGLTIGRPHHTSFICSAETKLHAYIYNCKLLRESPTFNNNYLLLLHFVDRFLTRTTQPAHILAICIPSFVLLTIWPDLIYGSGGGGGGGVTSRQSTDNSATHTNNKYMHDISEDDYSPTSGTTTHYKLALIAYLGAFAIHFGSQIWMTFVSGKRIIDF